jgi:hypothetical protein
MNLDDVPIREGDYALGALGTKLLLCNAPQFIVQGWLKYASDRQTLVFVPTIETAEVTVEAFRREGVAAAIVTGSTPDDERADILAAYSESHINVIVNCSVLTEGVDLPMTSCVVIARPTLSPILYAQMVGRGTRPCEGKDDCLILDLAGATSRHRLNALGEGDKPSLSSLVGIKLGDGESVLEAAMAAEDKRRRIQELLKKAAALRSIPVDLFGQLHLHWVALETDPPCWVVECGDPGKLVLITRNAAKDGYSLKHIPKRGRIETIIPWGKRTSCLLAAEHKVRQWGVVKIAEGRWNVPWEPATLKQKARLREYLGENVPVEQLTKRQASDMLTAHFSTERLRRARMVA